MPVNEPFAKRNECTKINVSNNYVLANKDCFYLFIYVGTYLQPVNITRCKQRDSFHSLFPEITGRCKQIELTPLWNTISSALKISSHSGVSSLWINFYGRSLMSSLAFIFNILLICSFVRLQSLSDGCECLRVKNYHISQFHFYVHFACKYVQNLIPPCWKWCLSYMLQLASQYMMRTRMETLLVNDTDRNITIFSTPKKLQFMTSCDTILMDGTFKSCPKLLYQLFVIHWVKIMSTFLWFSPFCLVKVLKFIGVFFNCTKRDQCNAVALNAFINCGAGLPGRIMTSSLWSVSVV